MKDQKLTGSIRRLHSLLNVLGLESVATILLLGANKCAGRYVEPHTLFSHSFQSVLSFGLLIGADGGSGS